MEYRHFRSFLAVADQLSFTRAARELGIAQPALSVQIRQLEQEIGGTLLERTSRTVRLTPAGVVFRDRARTALAAAGAALDETRQALLGEAGALSLGYVSSALFGLLPRLLSHLRGQVPRARIVCEEMDPAEQLRAIRAGDIDFGLLHGDQRQPGLETRLLSREALIAALPKGHPAARQREVRLSSLLGGPLFLPRRHEHSLFHDQVLEACHQAGFEPPDLPSARLLLTAVFLVAGRQGAALVPESFRTLRVPGVVYRPLREPLPAVELIGVWRRENPAPLLQRLLRGLDDLAPTPR
jgi:DNA-binding transcriptional LysR family regulator